MAKISNWEQLAGANASYGLYPKKYAHVQTVFLLALFIFATGGYIHCRSTVGFCLSQFACCIFFGKKMWMLLFSVRESSCVQYDHFRSWYNCGKFPKNLFIEDRLEPVLTDIPKISSKFSKYWLVITYE